MRRKLMALTPTTRPEDLARCERRRKHSDRVAPALLCSPCAQTMTPTHRKTLEIRVHSIFALSGSGQAEQRQQLVSKWHPHLSAAASATHNRATRPCGRDWQLAQSRPVETRYPPPNAWMYPDLSLIHISEPTRRS